jgi:hypothetical protein
LILRLSEGKRHCLDFNDSGCPILPRLSRKGGICF